MYSVSLLPSPCLCQYPQKVTNRKESNFVVFNSCMFRVGGEGGVEIKRGRNLYPYLTIHFASPAVRGHSGEWFKRLSCSYCASVAKKRKEKKKKILPLSSSSEN